MTISTATLKRNGAKYIFASGALLAIIELIHPVEKPLMVYVYPSE